MTSDALGLRAPRSPSETGAEARDPAIEALRGLAVLLLVSAHVIGLNRQTGMRVGDGSWLRYFTDSFAFVRMPLFTVISGYVYDLRPALPGKIVEFVRGKARRLLLPMVTVASLQFLAKSSVPGVHHPVSLAEIASIYVFPFDQFWFLQALALVFVVIALLDGWGMLRPLSGWLGFGTAAVLACFFVPRGTTLFAYPSALYLLPFFMLGLGLHRFGAWLERPAITRTVLITLALVCAAHQWFLFGLWQPERAQLHTLAFTGGAAGCYALVRFRRPLPWLARLGAHSFPIYLFHVFAASGARIALERAGVSQPAFVLGSGIACGVLLPIAANWLLRRSRWTQLLFLGLRPTNRGRRRERGRSSEQLVLEASSP